MERIKFLYTQQADVILVLSVNCGLELVINFAATEKQCLNLFRRFVTRQNRLKRTFAQLFKSAAAGWKAQETFRGEDD